VSSERPDSDQRAALETEREFLLRSLEDLEAERTAGEIEADRYRALHDDYTARAAAVLRALEEHVDPPPAAPPVSGRRRMVVVLAVVAFAAVAGIALARTMGERLPGGTVTGKQVAAEGKEDAPAEGEDLERRVAENPDDPDAHLARARFLLGANNVVEAVKEFDATTRLDPNRAEAWAYSGWVFYLASRADAESSADLINRALERLDRALQVDQDYPDARFFKGMVLFRGKGDAAAAVPEFEHFLAVLPPDSPVAAQVKPVLEEAKKKAAGG
jgi:cytochrome c-type biogenesis protein CcmH/NrfG